MLAFPAFCVYVKFRLLLLIEQRFKIARGIVDLSAGIFLICKKVAVLQAMLAGELIVLRGRCGATKHNKH
ncbi:hypothetical protein [Bacteroides congonensis]|uniref:hypothetical protein n=1 Tax=Bacteroides congonensis TaxID=1871006 RepID=UPI00265E6CD2|nr:hypothetical protein [Bacteroides congonensis]